MKGVPGEIFPLPEGLDMPNNRELTLNPNTIWDPGQEYLGSAMWPHYWAEGYESQAGGAPVS